MPVIQQPGIWDFLGQALGQTAGTIQDQRKEDKEAKRQKVHQIALMVQNGQMDPEVANQNPDVIAMGYKFAATPQSTARKIMANPQGMSGQIPDMSKYIAPVGVGGAMTPMAMTTANKPWSADERSYAGLPSESAIKADKVAGAKADITGRYLQDPNSISPGQASAVGVKTGTELETETRGKVDPLMTGAANRYVDGMISASGIDLLDVKSLKKQAAVLSKSAFDAYVRDTQSSGSGTKLSPKDLAYAKSFFDQAVAEAVKTATEAQLKLRVVGMQQAGQRGDDATRWYNSLTATADDYDRQAKELAAATPGVMLVDPVKLPPAMQQTRQTIDALYKRSQTYRQSAMKFLPKNAGVNIPGEEPTGAPGGAPAPAASGMPDKTPEELATITSGMRRVPKEGQAAYLEARRGRLSGPDYLKIKKALGLP